LEACEQALKSDQDFGPKETEDRPASERLLSMGIVGLSLLRMTNIGRRMPVNTASAWFMFVRKRDDMSSRPSARTLDRVGRYG